MNDCCVDVLRETQTNMKNVYIYIYNITEDGKKIYVFDGLAGGTRLEEEFKIKI